MKYNKTPTKPIINRDHNTVQNLFTIQLLICVIMLITVINNVQAEDNKFSLGVSVSKDNLDLPHGNFTENGYKLDFGYSFNHIFSAELSYFKFGNINQILPVRGVVLPTPPPDTPRSLKYKIHAFDLSILARKKWDNFTLYAKLGWLTSDVEQTLFTFGGQAGRFNHSDSGLSYGVGVGYDLSNHLTIVLDHTASKIEDASIQMSSLGIKYRF